ncbi:MAG: two-component regulator propeller domain-containing protein [Bacteroidota bacterium]
MNKLLLTSIILVLTHQLWSQLNPTKNYNIGDGLQSNRVYTIHQDNNNELWFGTDRGVSLFDGKSFKNYTLSDGLSDTEIFKITSDDQNRIWFCTNNGQPAYYKNGVFHSKKNDLNLSDIPSGSFLWSVDTEKDGSIWLGTQSIGIIRIDTSGKIDTFQPNGDLTCFHSWDKNGLRYFAMSDGIYSKTHSGINKVIPYQRTYNRRFCISDDKLLMSNGKDLEMITNEKEVMPIHKFNADIIHISSDGDNTYWIGTESGLYKLDLLSGTTELKLPKRSITSVIRDHEGGLWIGTLNKGIYYCAPNSPKELYSSLEEGSNLSIFKYSKNRILIGSNGVYQISDIKGPYTNDVLKIASKINDVFKVHDGWNVATDNGIFINRLDKSYHLLQNGLVKEIEYCTDTSLFIVLSRLILKIPYSQLYNISKFTYVDESIRPFIIYNDAKPTVIRLIAGSLWIGTVDGVRIYDIQTNTISELISTSTISDILHYKNMVWVATHGEGIYQFDLNGELINHFHSGNGLQNDFSSMLAVDSLNQSIINVTTQGVDLGKQNHWINIPLNHELNPGRNSLQVIDSAIIFSSKNKLFQFNPHRWINSIKKNKIDRIELRANNTQIDATDNLNLHYFNNNISVSFKSISYQVNELIEFIYTLKRDSKIISSDTTRLNSLQFPALSPGNYEFKVVPIVRSIHEGDKLTLSFIINPPFWLTWWFKIIIGFLVIIVFYLFFKIRVLTYNKDVVRELLSALIKRLKPDRTIVLKDSGGKYSSFSVKDLMFIKAAENYVEVHSTKRKVLIRITMKEMESQLKKYPNFIRVHHSYIINKDQATDYSLSEIRISDHIIPVSRRKRHMLDIPKTRVSFK